MKKVEIKWFDARLMEDWHTDDEFNDDLAVAFTCGYLTRETEEAIYVTRDIDPFGPYPTYRHSLMIPKSAIITRFTEEVALRLEEEDL